MMTFEVPISELQPGDEVRWPDGTNTCGGYIWPTVLRCWHKDVNEYELLLGGVASTLESCPAAGGAVLTANSKTYPGDLTVTVRRLAAA